MGETGCQPQKAGGLSRSDVKLSVSCFHSILRDRFPGEYKASHYTTVSGAPQASNSREDANPSAYNLSTQAAFDARSLLQPEGCPIKRRCVVMAVIALPYPEW